MDTRASAGPGIGFRDVVRIFMVIIRLVLVVLTLIGTLGVRRKARYEEGCAEEEYEESAPEAKHIRNPILPSASARAIFSAPSSAAHSLHSCQSVPCASPSCCGERTPSCPPFNAAQTRALVSVIVLTKDVRISHVQLSRLVSDSPLVPHSPGSGDPTTTTTVRHIQSRLHIRPTYSSSHSGIVQDIHMQRVCRPSPQDIHAPVAIIIPPACSGNSSKG
jgi:hypothetical protein